MNIFWVAIIIVPALWLARIVWTILVYVIVFIFAGISSAFEFVIKKIKE